jgi:hypothetical protein
VPSPWGERSGEDTEAGGDAGHGGIEVDVLARQLRHVVFEAGQPFDEERVHDVVLRPVVVVDEHHDLGERPAERGLSDCLCNRT